MRRDLYSRLRNYKFAQAKKCLRGDEKQDTANVVIALAETFGDVRLGLGGHLGVIVDAALNFILPDEPDKEDL